MTCNLLDPSQISKKNIWDESGLYFQRISEVLLFFTTGGRKLQLAGDVVQRKWWWWSVVVVLLSYDSHVPGSGLGLFDMLVLVAAVDIESEM